MRGGLAEPWPTPTMPPKPPLARAFSSRTETLTLPDDAETAALTRSTNACGVRRFGGVLTRSRARSRADPMTAARSTAALRFLPEPCLDTTEIFGPSPFAGADDFFEPVARVEDASKV